MAAAPIITATKRITMFRAELEAIGFCCGAFFMVVAINTVQKEFKIISFQSLPQ
jgi:hypothetical protein